MLKKEKNIIFLTMATVSIILLLPMSKTIVDMAQIFIVATILAFLSLPILKNNSNYFLALIIITMSLNISIAREILSKNYNDIGNMNFAVEQISLMTQNNIFFASFVLLGLLIVIKFILNKIGDDTALKCAKFMINTMPTQQMSIDRDMAKKIITEDEANKRKKELEREVNYYGTLDGFTVILNIVFIANLFVVVFNLIAGVFISIFQYNITISKSFEVYSTIIISNGIVFQIFFIAFILIFIKMRKMASNLH